MKISIFFPVAAGKNSHRFLKAIGACLHVTGNRKNGNGINKGKMQVLKEFCQTQQFFCRWSKGKLFIRQWLY
jgi:hypothetical protein